MDKQRTERIDYKDGAIAVHISEEDTGECSCPTTGRVFASEEAFDEYLGPRPQTGPDLDLEFNIALDTSGYRTPCTVRQGTSGFTASLFHRGERITLGTFSSYAAAKDAGDKWKPKKAKKPSGPQYVNHEFASREGYWIVRETPSKRTSEHGTKGWSVWQKTKAGALVRHAGPCKPVEGKDSYYLDPRIDKEAKMFGSDWEFYVTKGVENFGDPNAERVGRQATAKARAVRRTQEEIFTYLDKEPSESSACGHLEMSRASYFRWKKRHQEALENGDWTAM